MTQTPFETRFDSLMDLARLPWFEVKGGSRLVTDDAVGPIIDMHSHLAMGFLRKLQVDLHRETPRTAYYLPATLPIDLDVYSNENFDDESLWRMKVDLAALFLTAQGMRTTHTAPNLLRDMADLGIVRSVVLPIDLPIGPQNSDMVLEAAERHPELLPFGSVHPMARRATERLTELRDRGALGIKLHPNAQFIAPDHPKTVHLCGRCGDFGLPVLFHCGPVGIEPASGRERCQVARYEKVIAEHPDTTFVLGHCGALQVDEALPYADRYPNTWFEVSSLGLSSMEQVFETVPHDRILYGTDWPFYHQAITLARVLMLTDDDERLRRAVLFDNAVRLLDLDPSRFTRTENIDDPVAATAH